MPSKVNQKTPTCEPRMFEFQKLEYVYKSYAFIVSPLSAVKGSANVKKIKFGIISKTIRSISFSLRPS